MAKVKERVAYLQGLTKGLNVDGKTPEGRAILHMIDVLGDIADDVECVHRQQQELETYVETLDEDLNDLEAEFYEDVLADDADFVELQCPVCHEEVSFEAQLLHEQDNVEVSCPHCGSIVYDNLTNNSNQVAYDHDHDHSSHHGEEYR